MSAANNHEPVEIEITSLPELRDQFEETRGWLFRGHRCATWRLEPTVVRYAMRNGYNEVPAVQAFERRCYKEFTRRALDHFQNLPQAYSAAEWLGFMQHFGAPTRLIDVSKSPWVAAFFAVEELDQQNRAAIWAIDPDVVRSADPEDLHRNRNDLLGYLVDPTQWAALAERNEGLKKFAPVESFDSSRVEVMEPFLGPDRINRQKGAFLFACSLARPACALLIDQAQKEKEGPKRRVRKLVIPGDLRNPLLEALSVMNIGADTLFPGADGFGRSLRVQN